MNFNSKDNTRYSLDIREDQDPTIQSQYSASTRICALVNLDRKKLNPYADIELFFESIFDIETAQGIGLDIWGRILGISRIFPMPDRENWFGFTEADYRPFNDCPFWNNDETFIKRKATDTEFRKLLLWKAACNISTADASALNMLLQKLFDNKEIVVHEAGVMCIEIYVFFPLTQYEFALLSNVGLLAKGAGVGVNIVEIWPPVFGFNEADYEPFDSAPMWGIYR